MSEKLKITGPGVLAMPPTTGDKLIMYDTSGNGSAGLGLGIQAGRMVCFVQTGNYFQFGIGSSSASVTEVARINGTGLGLGNVAAAHLLHLNSDDAAKPTTNTWTIASDERLKENIHAFTDGLAVLEKLEPITYRLNGLGGMQKGLKGISVLAQKVEPFIPYCITRHQYKLREDDQQPTEILGLNTSALTWVVVNALKELASRVRTLEASA